MVQGPIALQVYTVRDEAAADFAGTMQKIKAMGYDGVELAGLYDLQPEFIRQVLVVTGLTPVSAHVPYALLAADLTGTLTQYKTIGCTYIAIPYLEEERRPGSPGFADVMAFIPQIGKACADMGMTLLYHNHDFEFVKMPDGSYGLDYLYNEISADLLQTEIDTCWVNVAGEDPVGYVEKYAGRCPVVHLKDFYMDRDKAENEQFYELIGQDEKKKANKESNFEFRPVGYGLQDMPAIIKASQQSGAKWLVVEQDLSVDRPPLEAAKMSIDYLRQLK